MPIRVFIAAAAAAFLLAAPAGASGKPASKHDRDVIRFFAHHPKLMHTKAGERALWSIIDHVVSAISRAEQSARTVAAAKVSWPRHHALWTCIQKYEGAWNNHGPYHYGGLQMSWNWMGLIRGDAGNLSQIDQEVAAERGYANAGYSPSFLFQQWFNWDNAYGECYPLR